MQGDALVVYWLRDVTGAMELRSLEDGSLTRPVQLPGIGAVSSFSGRRELSEFFFTFTGFTEPGAIYR